MTRTSSLSAQLVGSLMERSAAQQLTHWARVGREVEEAGDISLRHIMEVLEKRRSYDDMTPEEQAVVRAEWTERIADRRAGFNLVEQFAEEGRSYVELDADGRVVRRGDRACT
ncbi:MAG: TA system antitoxin ParD family protein [Acidimicrobiales bacterium]